MTKSCEKNTVHLQTITEIRSYNNQTMNMIQEHWECKLDVLSWRFYVISSVQLLLPHDEEVF